MRFQDLTGTVGDFFRIGLGVGIRLKNISGALFIRNAADTADASLTASVVDISGDSLRLNSDAAASGADFTYTIRRPASGMTSALTLELPDNGGSPSQVLSRDATTSGKLVWSTIGGSVDKLAVDTTSLAFGSTSPVAMFTKPANALIQAVRGIIDTPFNGTPSLSIGITGSTSKYLASNQVDLTSPARTIFEVYPGIPAEGVESLIATYSAGGATVGAARIEVDYVIPN